MLAAKPMFNCGGGLVNTCLVYDWIHGSPSLTDSQRSKMRDHIAATAFQCAAVQESGHAFDVRRFGLDAIRLSGAQTDHDKALAVYRWVRRWMCFTNHRGAPAETLVARLHEHAVVHEPAKLLNVYGAHWCGGQTRAVELVWRALGYRAEKVCRGGHTIVGLHYQDYDGVCRWHGLDVSHSAVAWDSSYRRLLSLDELSSQWHAFYYQYGLPGNGCLGSP